MIPDPKKPHRGTGPHRLTSTTTSKPPIIATPPRVALRSKHEPSTSNDTSSTKSKTTTSGAPNSDDEEDNDAASKDAQQAQIADLQSEMQTMEHEFEHELTTLSHKLSNAHESTQFWQSKHSSLNQTFLKTDTDLRLLRADIERERERVDGLVAERERFREAYNGVLGEVRERDEVVRGLRGQVRGLKSWVSSSGKSGEQVSDEVFGEGMVRLGNGLQNWVIVNFRRVRVDAEKANDETRELLLRLIPTYESLAATSKIHLIQSLVSRLLVESVFTAYFVGISKEQANELQKVERYLGDFGPVESINTWRSTTLAILRKDSSQKLQTETTAIVDSVVNQINTIMTSISDVQPSEARDQSLRALINSSIELSRLLRVQKAVFTIIMPSLEGHQRTMFDPDSMEDIGGEDEDTLSDREIRCVTFPGIVKAGDENGERGYLRNVVAKIRVLCAPD